MTTFSTLSLSSRAPPPPLPPRPTTNTRAAAAIEPPAIQETPASPTRTSAPQPSPSFGLGLVPPPSPSFVPASPSSHRYPSQLGFATTSSSPHAAFMPNDDAGLVPPPPAYSPTPQPGESTLPSDHSPLLPPAPIASTTVAALAPTQPPFPYRTATADPSTSIQSLVSTLIPILRSPTSYLRPIHPLPRLLYVSGSRLVLSPLSGSHLWHTNSPASVHILTLPRNTHTYTPTGDASEANTISVTILPLIPLPASTPDMLLSTLVQVATALHMRQYYPDASLSAPNHDTVPMVFRNNPTMAGHWSRVSLNAELDNKKNPRTGKTPRRTYVALHVPRMALSDDWVSANGGADGAVLVVYADCFMGMLETNVIGMAMRAMVASGVVL